MQLDLFVDSPNTMNPNKNILWPDCFASYKQYLEWLHLARIVKEPANVCDDCNFDHQKKMMVVKRCHRDWIVMNWNVGRKG